tara:strand:- start:1109 stop:3883 length:2775 start_codon:yes stop_codon:yes gene_type:complete
MVEVQYRSESGALPTSTSHVTASSYIVDMIDIDDANESANLDTEQDWVIENDGASDGSGEAPEAEGGHRRNGLMRIDLPSRPDPAAGEISKVILNLTLQSSGSGSNTQSNQVNVYKVTNNQWIENQVTWANYKTGVGWNTSGGEYDTSTDYGLGATGKIAEVRHSEATPAYDLSALCKAHAGGKGKYSWGDVMDLIFVFSSVYSGSGDETRSGNSKYFSHEYAGDEDYKPWVEIYFENPTPDPPFISVIPDTNGIDPKIQVDKHSESSHIARYSIGWDNVATIIEHGGAGVDMTDSDAVGLGTMPTIIPASKLTTTTLLDTEDVAYSVFVVAEKLYNQDTVGAKSNQVTIARPKVDTTSGASTESGVLTGSNAAATKTVNIGEEVQIRIKSTSSVHSGKIKRFWINWEANISDTAEDYGQFDVDENVDGSTTVTNKTFTHVYDRDESSNFTIKVQVEDEVGFRSNSTLIATITVNTPRPIAKLTTSRSQVIAATKADINNTVVVSGQHSYAQGSNRYIKGYKYKHNGGGGDAPLTAFPTANDNSVIYDSGTSERVALGASLDDCGGNTFRIYGIYSVDDDGGDIEDSHATFSHYVWGYEELAPNSSKVVGFTNGSHYFKHISYVVCNAASIDAHDTGAFYSLVLRDDNSKIINNQLAVEKDNYKWGGYYDAYTISAQVTGSNTYDQASGTNYFASVLGLRAGDKVLVSGSSASENNGIKTVVSATEDDLVVAETLSDHTAQALNFQRVTDHIVSVPVASFSTQTNTITHDIVDDNAQTAASTSTQSIQVIADTRLVYDLATDVDAGHIAILNTTLARSGGLSPVMTAGDRRYPLGLSRTKLGLPTLTMNVRVMSNEGLRNMWSLVEGDRFAWVTLKKNLIDAPDPLVPYRTLRLKPTAASLSKTPTDNKDYTASLTFVVMGEDI